MMFFNIIQYLYYTKIITANDIISLAVMNKYIKNIIYELKLNMPVKINLAFVDSDTTIIKYFNCQNVFFQNTIIFNNRFNMFNKISKIIFDDCKTVTDETLEHISRFNLHTLVIIQQNMRFSLNSLTNKPKTLKFDIYINQENMEYIATNQFVKSLDLTNCEIAPEIMSTFSCCQLENLDLENTTPLNISLKNLNNLLFLNLMNAVINDDYLKYIPSNVEILNLSNTNISSLDNLECVNLKELHIDQTYIEEINNIQRFTKLEKLCINYTVDKEDEFVYHYKPRMQNKTIQNLSNLHSLSILDISGCIENEKQLKFLQYLHLDELYVNNVKLTKLGISYLCNVNNIFFSHMEQKSLLFDD